MLVLSFVDTISLLLTKKDERLPKSHYISYSIVTTRGKAGICIPDVPLLPKLQVYPSFCTAVASDEFYLIFD